MCLEHREQYTCHWRIKQPWHAQSPPTVDVSWVEPHETASNSSRNYITGLPVKSSWSVYSVPCFRATCTDEKLSNIKGADHLSQSSLSGLNGTTGRSSSSSTPPATTTSPLMLGNSLKIPQWHFVRVPSSAWRILEKPHHTVLWLASKYKVIKSLQFQNFCVLFPKINLSGVLYLVETGPPNN